MRKEICRNCGSEIFITDEEEAIIRKKLPAATDLDIVSFYCRNYDSNSEICNGENAEAAFSANNGLPYFEY